MARNLSLNHLTRYRARWRFFSEFERDDEGDREQDVHHAQGLGGPGRVRFLVGPGGGEREHPGFDARHSDGGEEIRRGGYGGQAGVVALSRRRFVVE